MISPKIGLIFVGGFPEGDVHNSRIKNIGLAFKNQGWICDFISLYPSSYSKNNNSPFQSEWKSCKVIHIGGWYRYPKTFFSRIVQFIYCHISFLWFMIKNVRRYDILYFYTPQWSSSLLGLVLAHRLGAKTIVDYTDLHSASSYPVIHQSEESYIIKHSSALLVISDYLFSHFLDKHSNIHQLPMMINFDDFQQKNEATPFHIGYIGSFGAKDDLLLVYKALKIALRSEPRIKLVLIGNDPKPRLTEEQLKNFGIESHVIRIGRVKHSAISYQLQQCDTFIMNRTNSIFSDSGYPAKLGDYLACNRPILMSDGKGFSQDFTHKKEVFKYKQDDHEDLAKAMIYRYNNMDEMNTMAEQAFVFAKNHFDYKRVTTQIISVAVDLLKS